MNAPRKGDWFLTYTGKQFWPLDPRPEDVCIRDIAHHLSLICRFNGACRTHYSVAQHSVLVADLIPAPLKLHGLLHDATEAYVGDMVRPLKRDMPAFCEVEKRIAEVIAVKFCLKLPALLDKEPAVRERIKFYDNMALMTERRDLMVKSPFSWSVSEPPDADKVVPLTSSQAETLFLETFDDLWGMEGNEERRRAVAAPE